MDMQEIIISLLKERDEIPSKTILFHLINNNLINTTFPYEFEMANDKYITFNEVTFLHLSVFYHRMDVCRELMNNGAIVSSLCIESHSVLNLIDLYLDNFQNLNDDIEIEKDIQFLSSLLQENELTEALYRNLYNYNIISILLDFGANPNDYRGLSMIQYDEILYRIFMSHGFDVNTRDRNGNTFLHLSVCANHQDTIRWLLVNGADKMSRNGDGKTPYECFIECGYDGDDDIIHLLQI